MDNSSEITQSNQARFVTLMIIDPRRKGKILRETKRVEQHRVIYATPLTTIIGKDETFETAAMRKLGKDFPFRCDDYTLHTDNFVLNDDNITVSIEINKKVFIGNELFWINTDGAHIHYAWV